MADWVDSIDAHGPNGKKDVRKYQRAKKLLFQYLRQVKLRENWSREPFGREQAAEGQVREGDVTKRQAVIEIEDVAELWVDTHLQFVGNCEKGLPHGFGCFTKHLDQKTGPSGVHWRYAGATERGFPQGYGVLLYNSCKQEKQRIFVYEGYFEQGQPEGLGYAYQLTSMAETHVHNTKDHETWKMLHSLATEKGFVVAPEPLKRLVEQSKAHFLELKTCLDQCRVQEDYEMMLPLSLLRVSFPSFFQQNRIETVKGIDNSTADCKVLGSLMTGNSYFGPFSCSQKAKVGLLKICHKDEKDAHHRTIRVQNESDYDLCFGEMLENNLHGFGTMVRFRRQHEDKFEESSTGQASENLDSKPVDTADKSSPLLPLSALTDSTVHQKVLNRILCSRQSPVIAELYAGFWSHGAFHGSARHVYVRPLCSRSPKTTHRPNALVDTYVGLYEHGKRQGAGIFHFNDASELKVDYANNLKHGLGILFEKQFAFNTVWSSSAFSEEKRAADAALKMESADAKSKLTSCEKQRSEIMTSCRIEFRKDHLVSSIRQETRKAKDERNMKQVIEKKVRIDKPLNSGGSARLLDMQQHDPIFPKNQSARLRAV